MNYGKMVTMKCPRTGCKNLAVVSRIYGILPCLKCQVEDGKHRLFRKYEFATISRSNRIQEQRDNCAKDLLQPYNRGRANEDFFKAYPERIEEYEVREELEKK